MFKKIVDKIIEREVDGRRTEILLKSEQFRKKIREEEQKIIEKASQEANAKIELLNSQFKNKENELNDSLKKKLNEIKKQQDEEINKFIEQENKRIADVSREHINKKEKLLQHQEDELAEFKNKHSLLILELEKSAERQILSLEETKKKVEETRQKIEESQKDLWDKLDILRDNLNTEQIWMKLWECAFNKAVDVVWPILKKEAVVLAEYAKIDGKEEEREKLEIRHKREIELLVSQSQEQVNVPLLLKLKGDINKDYLIASKCNDNIRASYLRGQLELIKEIYKEKL